MCNYCIEFVSIRCGIEFWQIAFGNWPRKRVCAYPKQQRKENICHDTIERNITESNFILNTWQSVQLNCMCVSLLWLSSWSWMRLSSSRYSTHTHSHTQFVIVLFYLRSFFLFGWQMILSKKVRERERTEHESNNNNSNSDSNKQQHIAFDAFHLSIFISSVNFLLLFSNEMCLLHWQWCSEVLFVVWPQVVIMKTKQKPIKCQIRYSIPLDCWCPLMNPFALFSFSADWPNLTVRIHKISNHYVRKWV